ncbi:MULTISPECIES: NAD-dependent epimerase/dehydratase family protein [Desulfosediminicola]|uniref:NAD-dependent epimerase/dehydratase family protein n=1 Tax=Desulfosediminicola TaxID=2886823 RepID=UPI00142EF695|nr:NAD-dependent epimerase/dehydratase family protein [Desulfosediminicola ganghwensis]
MRALVTGATGFTGGILAEKLYQQGHHVRVLVRDRNRISSPSAGKFEVIESELTQREQLERAVQDIEVVFHIAAIYRQAGVPDQEYWDVNVKASENLLQLAHLAGAKRFVHCSTVGVHGDIEEPPADETYRFSPGDIYQITKLAAEKKVLEYHRKTGFPVSVIRPGAIYGAGDMRLLKLFKLASKSITPVLGDGNVFYNMVYVEDLADIFILAGQKEEAVGEVFLGAGPENLRLNDILDKISFILSKPSRKVHLPVKPFQVAGTLCEKICIPLGIEPPIYRRRIDFFTKSRSFSIEKSRRLLGYNPQFDYTRGLARTAGWYREHNLL